MLSVCSQHTCVAQLSSECFITWPQPTMPALEKGDPAAILLDKDAGIKNKWRWEWLDEKNKKGSPFGQRCQKLRQAGVCLDYIGCTAVPMPE